VGEGHFLTCLQNELETYRNYSLPGSHDTHDIYKVVGSKVKVTNNIFRKRTFPIVEGLLSKTI